MADKLHGRDNEALRYDQQSRYSEPDREIGREREKEKKRKGAKRSERERKRLS